MTTSYAPPQLHPDTHPARWRVLALLSAAVLLGMALWFAGSAIAPQLAERWDLTPSQTAWLTTSVQLGFVLGTAVSALLNLADVLPARLLFAGSAALGAAANLALIAAPDFRSAILWRLATGFALAGVYPPAMKMIATWFRARRGLAIGAIVGALTVGKALPYLIHSFPAAGTSAVLIVVSAAALLGALLVLLGYRDGPYPFAVRPFSWSLVAVVVRERRWRLTTAGYLGHMFELYSAWTWLPVFLAASVAAAGTRDPAASGAMGDAIGFAAIAIGGAGCIWGGLAADRIGRERLVTISLAVSGSCAALIGIAYGGSVWLVAAVALVWGFFVIADSAQFSTMVTDSVPPHAVGTALTLQVSLGFLLTAFTIQLVPVLAERVGWRWAFIVLALGPVLGIAAIRRLRAVYRSPTAREDSAPLPAA